MVPEVSGKAMALPPGTRTFRKTGRRTLSAQDASSERGSPSRNRALPTSRPSTVSPKTAGEVFSVRSRSRAIGCKPIRRVTRGDVEVPLLSIASASDRECLADACHGLSTDRSDEGAELRLRHGVEIAEIHTGSPFEAFLQTQLDLRRRASSSGRDGRHGDGMKNLDQGRSAENEHGAPLVGARSIQKPDLASVQGSGHA